MAPASQITRTEDHVGSHGYGRTVTLVTIDTGNLGNTYVQYGDDWSRLCGKCGGTGHLDGYEFIANGVCFGCGGAGNCSVRSVASEADAIKRERQRWDARRP